MVVSQGLQLACIRHIIARLVLGQDLHERPQFQPPLLLGDPVPGRKTGQPSSITFCTEDNSQLLQAAGNCLKSLPKKDEPGFVVQ